MLIRALTKSDAEQFWEIRLRALAESPEAFGASYEEEANVTLDSRISKFINSTIAPSESNFVLGAFNDDNIIGIVGFRREVRSKLKHKSNLWGMYVEPEFRRSGIGRRLVSELVKKAQAIEGLEQIYLGVVNSNTRAVNLYSSLGFIKYGTERNALKIGDEYFDEDLMVLFI